MNRNSRIGYKNCVKHEEADVRSGVGGNALRKVVNKYNYQSDEVIRTLRAKLRKLKAGHYQAETRRMDESITNRLFKDITIQDISNIPDPEGKSCPAGVTLPPAGAVPDSYRYCSLEEHA